MTIFPVFCRKWLIQKTTAQHAVERLSKIMSTVLFEEISGHPAQQDRRSTPLNPLYLR